MKNANRFLFIALVLLFWNCQPENHQCFKSNGEDTIVTIHTESFNTISIEDFMYVELTPDTCYAITLKGGKNILPFIRQEFIDNELHIYNDNKCNWMRNYSFPIVQISFTTLNELKVTNSGVISCTDTLRFDNFSVDNRAGLSNIDLMIVCDSIWLRTHAGTGDMNVCGQSTYAYMYNIGSEHVHAENFEVETLHAVHRSTGNMNINVSHMLMVEDIQHGNLYYYGCPEIIYAAPELVPFMIDMGCE